MIKIHDGTPTQHTQKSLCDTCQHGQVSRGIRFQDVLRFCRYGSDAVSVSFTVHECSLYESREGTSLWEMEKVAWRFSVDRAGKKAGFAPPKKDTGGCTTD